MAQIRMKPSPPCGRRPRGDHSQARFSAKRWNLLVKNGDKDPYNKISRLPYGQTFDQLNGYDMRRAEMSDQKEWVSKTEQDFDEAINLFWRDTKIMDVLRDHVTQAVHFQPPGKGDGDDETLRLPRLTKRADHEVRDELFKKIVGLNAFVNFETARVLARGIMHIYISLPPESRCRLRPNIKWAFSSRAEVALNLSKQNRAHNLIDEAEKYGALSKWLNTSLQDVISAKVDRMVSPVDVGGRYVGILDPAMQEKIKRKAQKRILSVMDAKGELTENEMLLNTLGIDLKKYPIRKKPKRKKRKKIKAVSSSLPSLAPIHRIEDPTRLPKSAPERPTERPTERRRRQTTCRHDRRKERHRLAIVSFQAKIRGNQAREVYDQRILQSRLELVLPSTSTALLDDERHLKERQRRNTRRQSRLVEEGLGSQTARPHPTVFTLLEFEHASEEPVSELQAFVKCFITIVMADGSRAAKKEPSMAKEKQPSKNVSPTRFDVKRCIDSWIDVGIRRVEFKS